MDMLLAGKGGYKQQIWTSVGSVADLDSGCIVTLAIWTLAEGPFSVVNWPTDEDKLYNGFGKQT